MFPLKLLQKVINLGAGVVELQLIQVVEKMIVQVVIKSKYRHKQMKDSLTPKVYSCNRL